ncbi:MAG: Hydroxyquinol 1,2-dioxygenase, partial [Anaerolineales bacterium]|nr:Hydroxyquinol 1,2-dioxygenase [Anaerolineales bacterium]
NLTEAEWLAGIQFLTATGQMCDDKWQEFILLSDMLGATTMKDIINNRKPSGVTEYTILGPFHRAGAPELQWMDNLAGDAPGEPVIVRGRVRAPGGTPIPNAALDVWQSDAEGLYDLQMPDLDGMALRGIFHTNSEGQFAFHTIKPSFYPIPNDGPVGKLLRALGRHPYRPAHIHFILSAPGYESVTTELFVEGDPYVGSDAVFGVRDSLVAPFVRHASADEAARLNVSAPFYTVDYDFVLEPA